MTDCIFCKIRDGLVPTALCYQDDRVMAFNDIHPKAPLHLLIVPKQHIATLNDLQDVDLAGHLLSVATTLAKDAGVADHGYKVSINCNKGGGQEVFHLHLHLTASKAA